MENESVSKARIAEVFNGAMQNRTEGNVTDELIIQLIRYMAKELDVPISKTVELKPQG